MYRMTIKLSEVKKGDKFYYLLCHSEYSALTDWLGNKIEVYNLTYEYQTFLCYGDNEVELLVNDDDRSNDKKIDNFDDKIKINNIVQNSPDKKLKLYLGCFNKPIPGFVNVDIRPYPETLCDITDDILKLEKFENDSTDVILSVHTLEHVGRYEYMDALKVWYSKLRNNGEVYISVPDMQAVCEHYIYYHDLSFLYSFIWGSQKHEADKHFCGFDFDLLKKSLEEVGFKNVERYDWTKTPWSYIDSYAGAYAKHMDRNSRLMSLNIKATK